MMATILTEKYPEPKLTARDICRAALYYFGGTSTNEVCAPNIHFAGAERDVLLVTKSLYAVEIEAKLTLSDWNADQHKKKWVGGAQEIISRFYYAVPEHLVEKAPAWIPADHGLLVIRWDKIHGQWYCWTIKEAKRQSCRKVTPHEITAILRSVYYRGIRLLLKTGVGTV